MIVANKCDLLVDSNDDKKINYILYTLRSLALKYSASLILASGKYSKTLQNVTDFISYTTMDIDEV